MSAMGGKQTQTLKSAMADKRLLRRGYPSVPTVVTVARRVRRRGFLPWSCIGFAA
jgi:hypothetical protein